MLQCIKFTTFSDHKMACLENFEHDGYSSPPGRFGKRAMCLQLIVQSSSIFSHLTPAVRISVGARAMLILFLQSYTVNSHLAEVLFWSTSLMVNSESQVCLTI